MFCVEISGIITEKKGKQCCVPVGLSISLFCLLSIDVAAADQLSLAWMTSRNRKKKSTYGDRSRER